MTLNCDRRSIEEERRALTHLISVGCSGGRTVRQPTVGLNQRGRSLAMCGFAGLLTAAGTRRDQLADHASRMIAPIAHRGPDDSGIWADEQTGVALGFRRLAILDLSPHGPSTDGVALRPLRHGVQRRGLQLRGASRRARTPRVTASAGHSDTEVDPRRLRAMGHSRGRAPRSSGMFAIAVWDAHRRELSLVRDRLGKKPLYVYREPGLHHLRVGAEGARGRAVVRPLDRSRRRSRPIFRYLYVPGAEEHLPARIKMPPATS